MIAFPRSPYQIGQPPTRPWRALPERIRGGKGNFRLPRYGRCTQNTWKWRSKDAKSLILERNGSTCWGPFSTGLRFVSTCWGPFSTSRFFCQIAILFIYLFVYKEEEEINCIHGKLLQSTGCGELPKKASTGYCRDPRVLRGCHDVKFSLQSTGCDSIHAFHASTACFACGYPEGNGNG